MAYFTTSDGLKLYYTDEGAGLPILCLAGLTRTTADFDYVTPHLTGHRLIKLDYRGRGQSDFDPDWSHYSLPVECRDIIELLDHLELEKVAILGTSRGGLNAMGLARGAKHRLLGVALNDVGPVIDPKGIETIKDYIGRNPAAKTHAELAARLPRNMPGFANVPDSRWLDEAVKHYTQTPDGLQITYDPALRDAFLAAFEGPPVDLWPLWDATAGLPVALIRGANSDLLSQACTDEMRRRRPDMIFASVPDRAHIPFLDEPESLTALRAFVAAVEGAAP